MRISLINAHAAFKTSYSSSDPAILKNIEVIELDTTKDESVRRGVEHVINKEKRVDVLVNNAGLAYQGREGEKRGEEET